MIHCIQKVTTKTMIEKKLTYLRDTIMIFLAQNFILSLHIKNFLLFVLHELDTHL